MVGGISEKYGGLWKALAAELTAIAADQLTRRWSGHPKLESERAMWRRDIEAWVKSARGPIHNWLAAHGEDTRALEALTSLAPLAEHVPLRDFFTLVTSCSLFRLQPYRRTIIWEQHHNKVVPSSFVHNFVIGRKSDLTSGETAFAAFASDCEDFCNGLVVADGFRNLRGTYSIIDRILGIRNNAFVPIRGQGDRDDADSLLALVVVSLPVPNLFSADACREFSGVVRKYEEIFHFLLEMEQREERLALEQKLLSRAGGTELFLISFLIPCLAQEVKVGIANPRLAEARSRPVLSCGVKTPHPVPLLSRSTTR